MVDRRKIILELSQPNSYFDFQISKIRCKSQKNTMKNEKIRIKEKKEHKLDIVAKCGNMEMHKALHFS